MSVLELVRLFTEGGIYTRPLLEENATVLTTPSLVSILSGSTSSPYQDAFLTHLSLHSRALHDRLRSKQCCRRHRLNHSWMVMLQELVLMERQSTRRQASPIL
jgi:hypothetical protein